jgi:hypothetical protein
MTYQTLRTKIKQDIFSLNEVKEAFASENYQYIKIQISRLSKSGSLIKIKNQLYAFYSVFIDYYCLGCKLQKNSYISLESVLFKYGVLDEAYMKEHGFNVINRYKDLNEHKFVSTPITMVTSGHSGKRQFPSKSPALVSYKYSEVTNDLFFGYKKVYSAINKYYFFEAYLEKAILDYIYLRKPAHLEHLDLSKCKDFKLSRYEKFVEKYPNWVQEYTYLLL